MKEALIYGESGTVEFNVVESEEFNKSNTITSNPIEDGSRISDHVEKTQDSLSFTAHLTGDRAEDQYEILRKLHDNGDVCVFTYKNYITNVIIETLKSTSTKKNKNGYQIDITVRQIKTVSYQTVNTWLPIYETQMKNLEDAGNEQPEDDETDEETEESWLVSIGNKISGWF